MEDNFTIIKFIITATSCKETTAYNFSQRHYRDRFVTVFTINKFHFTLILAIGLGNFKFESTKKPFDAAYWAFTRYFYLQPDETSSRLSTRITIIIITPHFALHFLFNQDRF